MTIKKIKIGTIGAQSVNMPAIIIGEKLGPKGTIICLQHGNELSPLWITKELIQREKEIMGTAAIIPIANPFGLINSTRNEPIDGKDLNRQFPGNSQGDLASRLAAQIFALCKNSDFVIDLHTFSRQSPFLVGYAKNPEKNQEKTQKIIQLLEPEVVWAVNEKIGADRRFQGSLDGALAELGIPSVFIEMPNYQMIGKKLINRIASGIIKVFSRINNIEVPQKNIPEYKAKYVYADIAGLFEPTVSVLSSVDAGQTIGIVNSLPDFKRIVITAPVTGVILTIKGPDVIRTGSKIGSIGM